MVHSRYPGTSLSKHSNCTMGLRARRSVVVDGLGWPSYATTGRVRRILTADIALSSCSVLSYVIESQAGISSKPTTHRQPIEGSQRPPVVAVPRHGIFQLIACRKMGDTCGSGEPVPVSDLEVSPLSFRARTAIRRGVSPSLWWARSTAENRSLRPIWSEL